MFLKSEISKYHSCPQCSQQDQFVRLPTDVDGRNDHYCGHCDNFYQMYAAGFQLVSSADHGNLEVLLAEVNELILTLSEQLNVQPKYHSLTYTKKELIEYEGEILCCECESEHLIELPIEYEQYPLYK